MDAQKIPSTCLPLDRSSAGGGNVSYKICTVAGYDCPDNLDAPVDATTAKSSDEDVTEAQTDLTLLDPVHWSPCGTDLLKDVRELNCQGSAASFLTDEKGSVELKTW